VKGAAALPWKTRQLKKLASRLLEVAFELVSLWDDGDCWTASSKKNVASVLRECVLAHQRHAALGSSRIMSR
jgi:hypothetical protein